MKYFNLFIFLFLIVLMGSKLDAQVTSCALNDNQGLFIYAGDQFNYDYTPVSEGPNNLKGYYTAGNIMKNNTINNGFWYHSRTSFSPAGVYPSTGNFNGRTPGQTQGSSVFELNNVTSSFNTNNALTVRMVLNSNSPAIILNRFRFGYLTNQNQSTVHNNLKFNVQVDVLKVSTGVVSTITGDATSGSSPLYVNSSSVYTLEPGETYEIRFKFRNDAATNTYSTIYVDNPVVYGVPVPRTSQSTYTACNTTTAVSSLNALLTSPITTSNSGEVGAFTSTVRWFKDGVLQNGNLVAGVYTPYYYNGSCYYGAGNTVTVAVNSSPALVSQPTPSTQSIYVNDLPSSLSGFSVSGSTPITYQWYKNTVSDNTTGTLITGATSSTYTPLTRTTVGTDYYYVVATNSCGSIRSNVMAVNFAKNPVCMKPGAAGGQNLDSRLGILTKPKTRENWPTEVRNGYIVLDGAAKGFVISYVNNVNQILNPIKGMMVYDTSASCVKLYRGNSPTINPTKTGWNCIAKACND